MGRDIEDWHLDNIIGFRRTVMNRALYAEVSIQILWSGVC